MRDTGIIGNISAHGTAFLYGNPSKSAHLILVAGQYGKSTTALLLANILEANGDKVAVFTNLKSSVLGEPYSRDYSASVRNLQSALRFAVKKHVDYVILEITGGINDLRIIRSLDYNSILATTIDQRLSSLFARTIEYLVLPYSDNSLSVPVAPHQIAYFGDTDKADIYLEKTNLMRGGTELGIVIDHHDNYQLATYLRGFANARNVAAAVAMAYVLGSSIDSLDEGVARLEVITGNFARIDINASYTLCVDSAASAESLELVLASAKAIAKRRLLVALGSDFDQTAITMANEYATQVTSYSVESADGHTILAKDFDDSVTVTTRGARLDDLVLLIGREYTTRDDNGYQIEGLLNTK